MTTTTQQRNRSDLLNQLKELDFISSFFSWVFLLLSRVAEPSMLLAAMYIIIEAGIPQAASPVMHNLSVGAMITAPEIILPGAFVLAAQARSRRKESKLLFTTCICFVLLTLVTLLSLFVFHFERDVINVIMFLRCATGIGYSILIRIYSHSPESVPEPPQTASQVPTALPALSQEQINAIAEQLQDRIRQIAGETIHNHLPQETRKPTVSSQEETTETETQKPSQRTARATGKLPRTSRSQRATITPINRKLVSDEQVKEAYEQLLHENNNGRVTADSLKQRAGIGKPRACQWLRDNTNQAEKRRAAEVA